ncbi:MAG: radical SAM protein [Candidatus Falkowbacteria bacterium]|nr:radical SAM protein [Candidatus Falkowbacteria bacterium]
MELNKPKFASWESTLSCPLRCKHCGLLGGKPRLNELSTDKAINMLDKLSTFGVKNLIISGGEFTHRKDWLVILEVALSLFKLVRIITSGHQGKKLFTELSKINKTANLVVSVSLDGAIKNHDLRRGRGSFNSVMEIINFPTPITKHVLTTVDKLNIIDCLDVLRICLQNKVSLWSLQISLPAGRMKPGLFLGQDKIILLAEQIKIWKEAFKNKLEISPDDCFANLFPKRSWGDWTGCHAGKNLITILSDGSITGCPTMGDTIAGNIKTDTLDSIWQSKTMSEIRNSVPKECLECGQCAGGCKAVNKLFKKQFCSPN